MTRPAGDGTGSGSRALTIQTLIPMSNSASPLAVGVDISKRWFDAAVSDGRTRRFDNDDAGHHAFVRVASQTGSRRRGGDRHLRP